MKFLFKNINGLSLFDIPQGVETNEVKSKLDTLRSIFKCIAIVFCISSWKTCELIDIKPDNWMYCIYLVGGLGIIFLIFLTPLLVSMSMDLWIYKMKHKYDIS